MAANFELCPICKTDRFQVTGDADHGNRLYVDCAICGKYTIGRMARLHLTPMPANPRLSAFIRRANLKSPGEEVAIEREGLGDLLASLKIVEIGDRPSELLESLTLMTQAPGEIVALMPQVDYPLAWASNSDELTFHANALEELGLVSIPQRTLDGRLGIVVRHRGWAEKSKAQALKADTAFVAMSFSQQLLGIWTNGIRPGVRLAGYEPKRVDTDAHVGRIDLKILADIRAAKFLVCDVTEQKPGVYFESGFAIALEKPVIWTVRRDEIERVHFDTRQFAHILWENEEDLKTQLALVIRGVIGQGPLDPVRE
jgi:nucleoside 2-deoxyribosyltransferase